MIMIDCEGNLGVKNDNISEATKILSPQRTDEIIERMETLRAFLAPRLAFPRLDFLA